MKKRYLTGLSIVAMVALVGCGGGSDSTSTGGTQSNVLNGNIVDGNVSGVSFECKSSAGAVDTNGTSDANGAFTYKAGDKCTFKIGDMIIGTVSPTGANAIITPKELMGASNYTDANVTNLAILLQSLDSDGNASNGIDLTSAVPQFRGTTPPVFDFKTADENTTVAFAKNLFPSAKTITAVDAKAHMLSTLNGMGINTGTVDNNTSTGGGSTPTPTVSGFTPATGAVGTSVTISGTNLGNFTPAPVVKFGTTVATVSSATATSITVTVPTGLSVGNSTITLANFNGTGVVTAGSFNVSTSSGGGAVAKIPTVDTSICDSNASLGTLGTRYDQCHASAVTNFATTVTDSGRNATCTMSYTDGTMIVSDGTTTVNVYLNGDVDDRIKTGSDPMYIMASEAGTERKWAQINVWGTTGYVTITGNLNNSTQFTCYGLAQ
ncbi:MAG: IPT/TIG domain-containing protein [Sulfuricurvum sp.]|uniref:IPT/TIG domain-containing protein n=1 Tax=Sulfuricurvum sp. TaxID=2025608 RepID=UPI00261A4E0A|nr:IPT/TIG domain-containing protein [Sulfuricurvum sp.]MDD2829362.1 IPT/TIG domain-containing protein [Sulfuricurvum sp.]MDD4949146.1 IPT/TIG domain-containing protein [Sulfuricurvum sp.]